MWDGYNFIPCGVVWLWNNCTLSDDSPVDLGGAKGPWPWSHGPKKYTLRMAIFMHKQYIFAEKFQPCFSFSFIPKLKTGCKKQSTVLTTLFSTIDSDEINHILEFHYFYRNSSTILGHTCSGPSDKTVCPPLSFTIENGPLWGCTCYRSFGWSIRLVWSIQSMMLHWFQW